jgi:hypothetical protein
MARGRVPHPSRVLCGMGGMSPLHTPPHESPASALAFVFAFLSVIPLRGICFYLCRCPCLSFCHSPQGNLLLPLPLPLLFYLSFPSGESASPAPKARVIPAQGNALGQWR